ncbi:baseplate J/gp47 family protein [Serratia ureilytica]|uniref:baseplate assembly protein n=1 Tax=Serratia ureilytica TaxID=300181 RepID=UPI003716C2AB
MSGTIDLSQLPPPDVIETVDFEVLLSDIKQYLIDCFPEEERPAVRRALALESSMLSITCQALAYREMLLRQRINEAARANMLAFALGTDLEHLAALFNVERLTIVPEDGSTTPPTPAVMEADSQLRQRVPQAMEGMSVAGPMAAYEFHARSADGRIADASAVSPSPAYVTVSVLSTEGNGTADAALVAKVEQALNDEDVRPVADRVTVQSADIVEYQIDAVVYVYPGPEIELVLEAATQRLQSYTKEQRRLGRDISLSAIYAALHAEGVQRVELKSPTANIVLDRTQAAYCTAQSITSGGYDE